MGQYHATINLDKKAGYSARSVASFIKVMEQAHTSTATGALILLLADENGWGQDRVAMVGDYAEDTDLPQFMEQAGISATGLYHRISDSDGIKNVGWLARKMLTESGLATFEGQHYGGYSSDVAFVTPKADESPQVRVLNMDKNEVISPQLLGDTGTLHDAAINGVLGGTGTALVSLLAASCKGGARGGGDIFSMSPLVGSWAEDHIWVAPEGRVPQDATDITASVRDMLQEAHEGLYTVNGSTVTRSGDPWGQVA